MTRTATMEPSEGPISYGVGSVDSLEEALRAPHLSVALPSNTTLNSIEDILADACCGLLLGERPKVFVDKKHYVAVIPIPPERVERVLYKNYITHKPSGMRYQCTFNPVSAAVPIQKRISIELPGAKFAWLKAQSHIRDHLYSFEPLIRVNWQQCTGAEKCKIHLHYSSDDEQTLIEAEGLRAWIFAEADKVIIRSFPLYVPPRNRYGLSSDSKFREIAYNHCVSLWTRTMKDSPIGNDWCTFATDDMDQMNATLQAYREYGMTTKWGAKSPATSPSQSPPASHNTSPSRRTSHAASSPPARAAERAPIGTHLHRDINATAHALGSLGLPPGLDVTDPALSAPAPVPVIASPHPTFNSLLFGTPQDTTREPYSLWDWNRPPTDVPFPAAASPASFASGAACWTQLMSPSLSDSTNIFDFDYASRVYSLTDSSG